VIYGSRNPDSERARELVAHTGHKARITTQKNAAQAADIVVLAIGWPAMETVAQNLGSLDGKIVIDISTAAKQDEDGYFTSVVKTSSAEMIQAWNPGARVVKAFAVQGSYVVDNPAVVGGPVSVPIAADDPQAKETVARIVAAMGMDPFDAGPLRYSREIEAFARLYMVPLLQRRTAAWEPYFRRSYFWECEWTDEYSDPVADHDRLANIPETQGPAKPCPGT
jgi:predicted dinucleotide-binding enzyme